MRCFPLVLAVAAGVLAGCGQASPKTHLAVRTDRADVVVGNPVTLSGTVRRGADPAAMNIELLASAAPLYSRTQRVGWTRSDPRGRFRFVVRPRINTAYTVATTGAVRHAVVFAGPLYRLRYVPGGGGLTRFSFVVDHPPPLVPATRPVQFYAAPRGRGELVRLGQAPLARVSPTRSAATASFIAPPLPIDAFACLPTAVADGYGAPPIAGCGRPRLRR